MHAPIPDAPIPDTSDFPNHRVTTEFLPAIADIPPPSRGTRLDPDEEAQLAGDGPELPDVGPDGFSAEYDDYDRWQAQMDLWLAGRGPRPE